MFGDKRRKIPLNSLEKFMLAHESEMVSYNSQVMLEYIGSDCYEKLKNALDVAMVEIPLLRSYVVETKWSFSRFYEKKNKARAEDVITTTENLLSQETIDQFCQQKFDLTKAPAFRFLLGKMPSGKNILIFNVHHTLCDAAGQFHILEEVFRLMNGQTVRDAAKTDSVFRYRQLHRYMGWKWFLTQIYREMKPVSKQRQYKMATLVDFPERPERFVTSITFSLNPSQQDKIKEACKKFEISITEYLTFCCFKAMDSTLKMRGDEKTPIMVYLPKTLRPLLKIRYSFQNILTTVWIVGKREEVGDLKFLQKIKHIISSHKMDKAAKFIFGSLWTSVVFPPKKLKSIYQQFDSNVDSITSSLLISAGRVPRTYVFPDDWKNISIWGRGTMLKSPGVGVMFTGVAGEETITLEYLKHLTKVETIEYFKECLLAEMLKDS